MHQLSTVYTMLLLLILSITFLLTGILWSSFGLSPDNMLTICIFLYLVFTIWFLRRYRRHHLFCFETLFFAISFVITFFSDLLLPLFETVSAVFLHNTFSQTIHTKSLIIQVLAILLYILGAVIIEHRPQKNQALDSFEGVTINRSTISLTEASVVATVIVVVYFFLLIIIGDVRTWFHYETVSLDYNNTRIVYLTILSIFATIIEFSRLSNLRIHRFIDVVRKINKFYISTVIAIGFLLLFSGNRNEALLVLLPVAVCYSLFIKRIRDFSFIVFAAIGVVLMIIIGLTRSRGVSIDSVNSASVSLYSIFQDYGPANLSADYLISYTDKNGPVLFLNAFLVLVSSIPFLGGIVKSVLGLEYGLRSTEITTQGMQMSYNMESGLGTNLVGDVYYMGGMVFVIVFFIVLGIIMGFSYKRLVIEKKYNVWLIINYVFCFSNAIYYPRAEWTMPFRYVGFAYVLVLVFWIVFHRQNTAKTRRSFK